MLFRSSIYFRSHTHPPPHSNRPPWLLSSRPVLRSFIPSLYEEPRTRISLTVLSSTLSTLRLTQSLYLPLTQRLPTPHLSLHHCPPPLLLVPPNINRVPISSVQTLHISILTHSIPQPCITISTPISLLTRILIIRSFQSLTIWSPQGHIVLAPRSTRSPTHVADRLLSPPPTPTPFATPQISLRATH